MPGYINTQISKLNSEEKCRYESFRCGLCRALSEHHTTIGRMTMNYDLAFVSLFLSALYDAPESLLPHKCQIHPFKNQTYIKSEIINYAADMNIILLYYHRTAHWTDTKNLFSFGEIKNLETECSKIEKRYPDKCAYIREQLSAIQSLRTASPELLSEHVSNIAGEIFVPFSDSLEHRLRTFGKAFGKYIYFRSSKVKFKKDYKKNSPSYTSSDQAFETIASSLLSDVHNAYKKLNIRKDCDIIEHFLLSDTVPKTQKETIIKK